MSIVNECFPKWVNLWISAEPLLGPIDLRWDDVVIKPKVVITGCESGPNRRPCKIEWVESIVEQCLAANVPVFVKQLDIGGNCVTDINKFPRHLQIRQVPWADDAIANGNTAHAVEECYDAISVLLRTIDVLEGRQKLGKPETKGETK